MIETKGTHLAISAFYRIPRLQISRLVSLGARQRGGIIALHSARNLP